MLIQLYFYLYKLNGSPEIFFQFLNPIKIVVNVLKQASLRLEGEKKPSYLDKSFYLLNRQDYNSKRQEHFSEAYEAWKWGGRIWF